MIDIYFNEEQAMDLLDALKKGGRWFVTPKKIDRGEAHLDLDPIEACSIWSIEVEKLNCWPPFRDLCSGGQVIRMQFNNTQRKKILEKFNEIKLTLSGN